MTFVSERISPPAGPRPSVTAYSVALLRAQHQILEAGSIFKDPLAVHLLGETDESVVRKEHPALKFPRLRQFVAARSRFAEDALAEAVARGVRQYVVLGAGFDTFGLRNPHAAKGLRVFEVDRPASQGWKKHTINVANYPIPPSLTFVPVNFERQSFLDRLVRCGFKRTEPAFFTWLGVVFYLSRKAVRATLATIATIPDAELVFDYAVPLDAVPLRERMVYQGIMDRAAAAGEPWLSLFEPSEVKTGLSKLGFTEFESLGPAEIGRRYFVKGRPVGGCIVRARKRGA